MAQTTAPTSRLLPSANRTVRPAASTSRGRNRTPARCRPRRLRADERLAGLQAAAEPGAGGDPHQARAGSATRTGRGRAAAAAAPGRSSRSTARPVGCRPAPRRSGSRSCRRRRPAPARRAEPAGLRYAAAVQLDHRAVQPGGQRRDERGLERAGRHDDLPGGVRPVGGAEPEAAVGALAARSPVRPAPPAGRRPWRSRAGSRRPPPCPDRCRPAPGTAGRAARRARPG